jgi:hypothetical protein
MKLSTPEPALSAMTDERFNQLERNLHAALSSQPVLRAPSSLEQRVRAEIARRAARPWWRRSFAEWPAVARAAFFALSGCAACICVAATLTVLNGPGAEFAGVFLQKFFAMRETMQSLAAAGSRWFSTISMGWFYLAGAIVAAAYVGLLGLGAAAYRLLWKAR